ncbi:sulfite exporter TauE/SafE family protein [Crateriforma conspicua]|uniref:Probable membrane transporter protein n=1 Tax=Crateriforma conspicua TaxID=2527996 RepID=A0A5C5Y659_9PLAN|nr:sulfite exporter TauE/SafE family protein [Crateriforma conspicua]QDV65218.1 Sulfite exporter TauE/SafE [Crateriforma conspicua]TWT70614.1 Sulfite exporter TauE/SafE [Crateriforma conspicua]
MDPLAVAFGAIVGLALGLTGGGGGIFAVPLLVYGLSVSPREAVGISLAAVGGTALLGVVQRVARHEVEFRTGILFAVAGMVSAPVGAFVATRLPGGLLLVLFAILMLVVAWQLWHKANHAPDVAPNNCQSEDGETDRRRCQRDADGQLRLTSRCARLLLLIGLMTGFLSGIFGIGGGFVIVPALVLASGMSIHRAVGTSLLVIVLISVSGVTSHLAGGNHISLSITSLFIVGGFAGMWLGGAVGKHLPAASLQKVFAVAIVLVAVFIVSKQIVLQMSL